MKKTIYFFALSGLGHSVAFATPYTFCREIGTNQNQAYDDAALTIRNPSMDKICNRPTAIEMGTQEQGYQLRCDKADSAKCRIGEGGKTEEGGPHDVPSMGWYIIPGDQVFKIVRCRCGCFTADTNILGLSNALKYLQIGPASAIADQNPLQLLVLNKDSFAYSKPLMRGDFTRGLEHESLLRIEVKNGNAIKLTNKHPVLLLTKNGLTMVQANRVRNGDKLATVDGKYLAVTRISKFDLPKESNFVFNVDTKAANQLGHVIVANGFLMGDVVWQERLSERESRTDMLLSR